MFEEKAEIQGGKDTIENIAKEIKNRGNREFRLAPMILILRSLTQTYTAGQTHLSSGLAEACRRKKPIRKVERSMSEQEQARPT